MKEKLLDTPMVKNFDVDDGGTASTEESGRSDNDVAITPEDNIVKILRHENKKSVQVYVESWNKRGSGWLQNLFGITITKTVMNAYKKSPCSPY